MLSTSTSLAENSALSALSRARISASRSSRVPSTPFDQVASSQLRTRPCISIIFRPELIHVARFVRKTHIQRTVIGWILAFYSIGFVAGTLYAGRIIEKVGHIRAFAVFAAVLTASILIYPMAVAAGLWGALQAG